MTGKMNKAGAEYIMWIVIAAAVALVAMVILLFIFRESTGKLAAGLVECESKLGQCVFIGECTGSVTKKTFECDDPQKECCFTSQKQVTT